MKCFVYVTAADVAIDIFSRMVALKVAPVALLVYLCSLSVCLRKLLPI